MTDMAIQGLTFVLIGAGLTGFSAESSAAMLEVKAQRDEALRALQLVLDNETTSNRIAATQIARRLIKKAKKWA